MNGAGLLGHRRFKQPQKLSSIFSAREMPSFNSPLFFPNTHYSDFHLSFFIPEYPDSAKRDSRIEMIYEVEP
jgi:hypothetical protein